MPSDCNRREGQWNAGRVLRALGRIGNNPVAALIDIADNSLSASANKITISVETSRDDSAGRGKSLD